MLNKICLSFTLLLALSFQVFTPSTYADFRCTREELALLLTEKELPEAPYHPLLYSFLTEFQSRFPSDSKISEFRVSYDREATRPDGRSSYTITPAYGPEPMGHVDVTVQNDTMRFDISVNKRFRGLNLYAYLLAIAIKEHPNVNSIPAIMPYFASDNATFFFKEAFKSFGRAKNSKIKDMLFEMSPSELIALRKKMISAFKETPSAKARRINGFSNVDFIVADFSGSNREPAGLTFNVLRGENSRKEIKVYIKTRNSTLYKITTKGKLKQVDDTEIELPDYHF